MKRVANVLLFLLQWALILHGLILILIAVHAYRMDVEWLAARPPAGAGEDTYTPPTFQRLVQGVTTGLIALGLGGVLLYLRRLYLLRRAQ